MLLAEPLFACMVGVAAIVLVVITAPLWTAAASRLSRLILSLFTRATDSVDRSLYGDHNKDEDEEDGP